MRVWGACLAFFSVSGGNGGGGDGATVVRDAKFTFLEAPSIHNTSVLYVKYTPNINIFRRKTESFTQVVYN